MRRSCYGVIRDDAYVYWPARPETPRRGVSTPELRTMLGQGGNGAAASKKKDPNLTNKAIMLLKTKDRENERSQTNPILCGAKRPLLLHGFGHPAKRHRKVELVQTHLDKGQ